MNTDETDCVPLLECTKVALRDEALQKLLISTQTNLVLSITTESNHREGDMEEDSDDDVSFVDATLSSPASVVSDVSVLLQDLTGYITKVGDHPVARGGFGEIWRCIYSTDQGQILVRFQCCFYQPF
jgi:hypothetical protein